MDDKTRALLGDREAAKRLTDAGVVLMQGDCLELREGENGWDGYVEKQKRVQLNISARIATIIMSSERTSGSKRSAKILFSAAAAEQETEQALRPPSPRRTSG